MLSNMTGYNPFNSIREYSVLWGGKYNETFFLLVRKELLLGGLIFETDEEFMEALKLLVEMDII